MQCPECGGETTVTKSRKYEDRVYRRRECLQCGERFTTDELRREEGESDE